MNIGCCNCSCSFGVDGWLMKRNKGWKKKKKFKDELRKPPPPKKKQPTPSFLTKESSSNCT